MSNESCHFSEHFFIRRRVTKKYVVSQSRKSNARQQVLLFFLSCLVVRRDIFLPAIRVRTYNNVPNRVYIYFLPEFLVYLSLTREQHVHELAVGSPGAHLLNLCEPWVQALVDPGQHVVSRQVVRRDRCGVDVHRHCCCCCCAVVASSLDMKERTNVGWTEVVEEL